MKVSQGQQSSLKNTVWEFKSKGADSSKIEWDIVFAMKYKNVIGYHKWQGRWGAIHPSEFI